MDRLGILVGSALFVAAILVMGWVVLVRTLRQVAARGGTRKPVIAVFVGFVGVGLSMIVVLLRVAIGDAEHEADLDRLRSEDFVAVAIGDRRITDRADIDRVVNAVSAATLCSRTYEMKRLRKVELVLERVDGSRLRADARFGATEAILTVYRDGIFGEFTSGSACTETLASALTAAGASLPAP